MKVALVHDYLKEYGGAERVLEVLHELFPDAPVYTSVYLPSYLGPHRERFTDWQIRTSWAQYIPFKAKLISPIRILSPWLFRSFDFSAYDVIITSATGAYFPNSLQKRNARLLCYCHTPPRYLYGYATARNWRKNRVMNGIGTIVNHFLRLVDFNASKHVDQYIANSEEVKRRIEKFYRKDAVVIYPPISIQKTQSTQTIGKSDSQKIRVSDNTDLLKHRNTESSEYSGKYFVAGGRLARPKHIDLIIKTCKETGVPLKVFGKAFAGYGEELKVLAESKGHRAKSETYSSSERSESRSKNESSSQLSLNNIEFLGEITDEEKYDLISGARAYLFASEDEDFGMLPVEVMALGTPVIAYRSGGVQESVIEGKTGLFFDALTVESLQKALQAFEKKTFDRKKIQARADEFSEAVFKKKMKKVIESAVSAR